MWKKICGSFLVDVTCKRPGEGHRLGNWFLTQSRIDQNPNPIDLTSFPDLIMHGSFQISNMA